ELFGDKSEESWTIAIMSDFKDKAHKIQEGRLQWILRTALPLSPGFNLFFNGNKIESSKVSIPLIKKWVIGKKDKVAEKNKYETSEEEGKHFIHFPHIRDVHGEIELYENSLVKGKSQDVGRSHGIFLMIRGRLINIDNPLIGSIEELNHATFNRIRIMVNADELDKYLTSGRESVKDCEAFSEVQTYISKKFNEAKSFWDNYITAKEEERNASNKMAYTSTSLSRRPIINVVKKFFKGDIEKPLLIDIPDNLSKEQQNKLISDLEEESISEKGIIKDIYMEALEPEDPIAKLDLTSRDVKINILHPFFTNFLHDFKSNLPFQLIATTEILTEALMIESGVDQEIVKIVMEKRDQLFRELTYNDNPNAPYVASMIKNALADSSGLENAVFFGFKSLGFNTTKIGGIGEPDGKALAVMGIINKNERGDYSLTYDAKSTKKDKIKAETIKASACVRHRKKYNANYSVVIAIDFEGADNPESAGNIEAEQQKVTLIRAKDFWKLVLLAIPKQLNYADYNEFFEKCHKVTETTKWINEIEKRSIEKQPIKELLETTYELMQTDIEPPNINAIRVKNKELNKLPKNELVSLVKSLNNLVPRHISIDKKENVRLETNPDRIMECINRAVEAIPQEFSDMFMKVFEVKTEKKKK
ncbi:MAG: hypothetical protein U9O94_02105, partial [Nanoarchaeota archaeon]|nr:hypothetical protein [Nanoarchaeota archaeon]